MHKNSFLFSQDPSWNKNQWHLRHILTPEIHSWIYEKNSLTHRLRQSFGYSLTVEILFHCWRPAFLSECRLLGLPHQQYNLTREVLLRVDEKPLILARTILPEKTIKIAKQNLSHLGTKPLGEVIFSYPKLQRLELNISYVSPLAWTNCLLDKVNIKQDIWGRRTVYAIQKQSLLVSEFFLPNVLDCPIKSRK